MRIAVVGSAGTGKTTLAKALAAHLGCAYLADTVHQVLRDRGRDSWRGVEVGDRRKIREEALQRKLRLEADAPAFVSDKSVIDYLAYWLQNQSEHEQRHVNDAFVDQCKEGALRYDLLVFLPYRADVDYAVGRNQDPVHNLKVAAHKRGLLVLLGLPHIEAPYSFGEDVGAWCERWVTPNLHKPAH
ncbi:MAG: ATP-binding protein [Deltaproteobacteria bacterium]|nr:ATP-binding protein [Deltaproteobacteria bacterium]